MGCSNSSFQQKEGGFEELFDFFLRKTTCTSIQMCKKIEKLCLREKYLLEGFRLRLVYWISNLKFFQKVFKLSNFCQNQDVCLFNLQKIIIFLTTKIPLIYLFSHEQSSFDKFGFTFPKRNATFFARSRHAKELTISKNKFLNFLVWTE